LTVGVSFCQSYSYLILFELHYTFTPLSQINQIIYNERFPRIAFPVDLSTFLNNILITYLYFEAVQFVDFKIIDIAISFSFIHPIFINLII